MLDLVVGVLRLNGGTDGLTVKLSEALSVIQRAPVDAQPFPVLFACGFSPLHLENYWRPICRPFARSQSSHLDRALR